MPLAIAAKNILDSYRFQLSLDGSLVKRVAYVTAYWGCYLCAKYCGRRRGDWAQAHLAALKLLARLGLSRRSVQVRLPDGTRLEVDLFTAHMILKEIVGDDEYGAAGEGPFSPRSGQVVFDVGAQQGIFSILCAKRVDHGKVVAVEPEPANYEKLTRNLSLNGFPNVKAVNVALSDKAGRLRLYRNSYNTGGHSLSDTGESSDSVEVGVSTLDALMSELGYGPDLLKIDVEGHGIAVLRGGAALLDRYHPRIIMEVEDPADVEIIRALLEPLGYRLETRARMLFGRVPDKTIDQ